MKCRVCNNKLVKFLSLGKMPLVNAFRKKEREKEIKIELSVGFCQKCYLVQLMKTVSPKKLFTDYIYFSSNSKSFLEHCERTAAHLIAKLGINRNHLVIEIASNDGAFLKNFKKQGIPILGIDSAKNIAEIANRKGIYTIADFFNFSLAKRLEKKHLTGDLIYGANVLAHVPKIIDFLTGVKTILKKHGSAVFEFPYAKGLFENKFDIIYHEHVFYFSILALVNAFEKADLEIYDVEFTPMQGGSLRIFASHPGTFKKRKRLATLIVKEQQRRFHHFATYTKMNDSIMKLRQCIRKKLKELKKGGKRIAAYGAPAKGVILLNYFKIEKYIDFIVDRAVEKQSLYVPGTRLKVYDPKKIFSDKPDYIFILSWNIADEIMKQLEEYSSLGGKYIIPIPELRVL